MYELLQQDKYKHLQTAKDYNEDQIIWYERMAHHTIDPTQEESIEIVKSLIDQYIPLFRSDKFNICCDETFDLANGKYTGKDTGKLYVDFVKKIIKHVKSHGKTPMMWADIILQHPEVIDELPDDVIFLNWHYSKNPPEDKFRTLSECGKTQIVCPGICTWSRFVEGIDIASSNIMDTLEYGYKYHSKGMLNTNWGDYGNPCSLELSMHGLVLGAAKAWSRDTEKNNEFDVSICALMYKNKDAVEYLTALDDINFKIGFDNLVRCYSNLIYERKFEVIYPSEDDLLYCIKNCKLLVEELSKTKWERDEFRIEMLSTANALWAMAEMYAKLAGYNINQSCDIERWLMNYRKNWLKNNKESELNRIEEMFTTLLHWKR